MFVSQFALCIQLLTETETRAKMIQYTKQMILTGKHMVWPGLSCMSATMFLYLYCISPQLSNIGKSPAGWDETYWENVICVATNCLCGDTHVGGEISTIIMRHMTKFGRISVCGAIGGYNEKDLLRPSGKPVPDLTIFRPTPVRKCRHRMIVTAGHLLALSYDWP
ncbi:hypothetical protein NQ317_002162 [Molorchus minor]|uniref:Uncharacterized protein n=1 Tax=Molorchus minor TaxID=1323400 RepID=A0ABQ9ITA2_9CUCU|nr:hypothetical protein NQ317_002162 [Molorchus minor]